MENSLTLYGQEYALVNNSTQEGKLLEYSFEDKKVKAATLSKEERILEEFVTKYIFTLNPKIEEFNILLNIEKESQNKFIWITVNYNEEEKVYKILYKDSQKSRDNLIELINTEMIMGISVGFYEVEFKKSKEDEGLIIFYSNLKENDLRSIVELELTSDKLKEFKFSRLVSKSKIIKYFLLNLFFIFIIVLAGTIPFYFKFINKEIINKPIVVKINKKVNTIRKLNNEIITIQTKIDYLEKKRKNIILNEKGKKYKPFVKSMIENIKTINGGDK